MSQKEYNQFCDKIKDDKINDVELISYFKPEYIYLRDSVNRTIIHLAAYHRRPLLIEHVIKHGLNVNTVSFWDYTPLHWACLGGHEECVNVLLDNGADNSKKDYLGLTCFDLAKDENQSPIKHEIKSSKDQENLGENLNDQNERLAERNVQLITNVQQSESSPIEDQHNLEAETEKNRLRLLAEDRENEDVSRNMETIEDKIESPQEDIKQQISNLDIDNVNLENEVSENSELEQNQPSQQIVASDTTRYILIPFIVMFYALLIYRGQYYILSLCILLMSVFVLYYSWF